MRESREEGKNMLEKIILIKENRRKYSDGRSLFGKVCIITGKKRGRTHYDNGKVWRASPKCPARSRIIFILFFLDSSLTIKGSKGFPSLIPHTDTVTVTKVTCMFVLFFYVTLLRLLIRKQCVTIKMQISFSSTDFLPLDGSRLTGESGGGGFVRLIIGFTQSIEFSLVTIEVDTLFYRRPHNKSLKKRERRRKKKKIQGNEYFVCFVFKFQN